MPFNWFELSPDEPDTITMQLLGRERYILTPGESVELAQALMGEAARFQGGILDLAPRVTRIDSGGRIYNVKFPVRQQVALPRDGLVAVRDLINEALVGESPASMAFPVAGCPRGSDEGGDNHT